MNKISGGLIILFLITIAIPISDASEYLKIQSIQLSPPNVVINQPEDGRTFCLPDILLSGYIEDDFGIVGYEILHEYTGKNQLIIIDLIGPNPFIEFNIPFTLKTGWNRLTVTATDSDLQIGEASVTVTYNPSPDIIPPTVEVSPPDGSISFNPIVELKIHATDNCGVIIHQIDLFRPNGSGETMFIDYISPWPIELWWNCSFNMGQGVNKIVVHVIDVGGHNVNITVNIRFIKSKNYLIENLMFPIISIMSKSSITNQ